MFKRDYERAAAHVRTLKANGVRPAIIEAVIDGYLAIFKSKSFDAFKWAKALEPDPSTPKRMRFTLYPYRNTRD